MREPRSYFSEVTQGTPLPPEFEAAWSPVEAEYERAGWSKGEIQARKAAAYATWRVAMGTANSCELCCA